MPDAIFIGYIKNIWGACSEPLVAFKSPEAAVAWKNEGNDREFKLVAWLD